MNIFLRSLTCACVFALPLSSTLAQITITEADVRDQMAVGKSLTNVADTLTKMVDIGSPGPTSWDFSGLLSHSSTTLLSVTPASTPYIGQFPDATFTFQTEVSVSGITATAYLYLVLSTNLLNPGLMGGTSTFLGPLVLKRVNTPSDIVYALPSTFGTMWTSAYTVQEEYTLNNSPIAPPTTTSHTVSYVVDAYGPMTLPGGSVHEALRIHKVDSTASWKTAGYIFLAKNGASVQITAADVASPDNGVIQASSVTWNGPVPTAVQDLGATPQEYALLQNYPNPFNPTTTIEYALPRQGHITLKVYNLLGEEVATLIEETMGVGGKTVQFDAAGLSSGVYIYRLKSGEFVESKRMMLIR